MALISTPTQGIMLLQGSFSAPGVSNAIVLSYGWFSLSLWGTFAASVQVERSPDNGATWLAVAEDSTGTYAIYTNPVSLNGFSPDTGVQFRLNCTALTSGTVSYRLAQQIELRRS